MKKKSLYIELHLLLLLYSFSAVLVKMAGKFRFPEPRFLLFYGGSLLILFIYAIAWQQIIKRMPLVYAYINKAITIFWGMLWGFVFFSETITIKNIVGVFMVVVGIICYSMAESKTNECS